MHQKLVKQYLISLCVNGNAKGTFIFMLSCNILQAVAKLQVRVSKLVFFPCSSWESEITGLKLDRIAHLEGEKSGY